MARKLHSVAVGIGVLWMAMNFASAQQVRLQTTSSSTQLTNQFCEEERRFAEPWIQWAAESRLACVQQTRSETERQGCLNTVLAQLDALEREHAEVYRSQMKALKSDHPVMVSIMQRLQANREFAKMALESGDDPAQLAKNREQSCLARQ